MKAKIKATGEVVDIEQIAHGLFRDLSGKSYMWSDFDFQSEPEQPSSGNTIDWEQRRYELAKAVIQGILADSDCDPNDEMLCAACIKLADEMVNQLKGGQG